MRVKYFWFLHATRRDQTDFSNRILRNKVTYPLGDYSESQIAGEIYTKQAGVFIT